MDTMVSNIGERVVVALEAAGYAESTMGQYRKSLRYLALLAQKQAGVYSPGLGAEFASMTTSPRTGMFSAQRRSDYGRLVRLFDGYLLTGRVDLSTKKRGGVGMVRSPRISPRYWPRGRRRWSNVAWRWPRGVPMVMRPATTFSIWRAPG